MIQAYVEPGLYVLTTRRTSGTGLAIASHSIDLPDVTPERVVLDPNFGDSYSLLRNTDVALDPRAIRDLDIVEEYRTTYYQVVTPAGSLAGTMAFAFNLSCPDDSVEDHALLSVWQEEDDSSFLRFDSETNFLDPPEPIPADPDCQRGQLGEGRPSVAMVQPVDENGQPIRALPFDEFIVALDRVDLATKVGIEARFEVPESGTPDLVLESLNLLPNDGETNVTVTIRNVGYGLAPLSEATVFMTGYASPVELNEFPLGPFASRSRSIPWKPNDPNDIVFYVTDSDDEIEELSEDNNALDRQLKEARRLSSDRRNRTGGRPGATGDPARSGDAISRRSPASPQISISSCTTWILILTRIKTESPTTIEQRPDFRTQRRTRFKGS